MQRIYKFDADIEKVVSFHVGVIKYHQAQLNQAASVMATRKGLKQGEGFTYNPEKLEFYVEEKEEVKDGSENSQPVFEDQPGQDGNK